MSQKKWRWWHGSIKFLRGRRGSMKLLHGSKSWWGSKNFVRKRRLTRFLKLLIICNIFFVHISIVIRFFSKENILLSLLNGVPTCSRALRLLRALSAWVLYVLACLACSRALSTWRTYVFGVLQQKWRAWPTSKNGVLGLLYKIACLACFKILRVWRAWRSLASFRKWWA